MSPGSIVGSFGTWCRLIGYNFQRSIFLRTAPPWYNLLSWQRSAHSHVEHRCGKGIAGRFAMNDSIKWLKSMFLYQNSLIWRYFGWVWALVTTECSASHCMAMWSRVGFLPEETYFFRDTRKKVEEIYFFQFCLDKTGGVTIRRAMIRYVSRYVGRDTTNDTISDDTPTNLESQTHFS